MRRYPQRAGEPLTRICGGAAGGCHEERWIEEFRILSSGCRCTYCMDCEAEQSRARHRRHPLPLLVPLAEALGVEG